MFCAHFVVFLHQIIHAMKNNNEQIERIQAMEERFDQLSQAAERLSTALKQYEEMQEAVTILGEYYGSDEWKKDFADDEKGLLPADLKHGVLSEDGLFNLLNRVEDVEDRFLDIVREFALEGEEE